ncbi:MAG: cytochrome c [Candidatus Eremiobacterota bacterium]
MIAVWLAATGGASAQDGKEIFSSKCTACHTVGGGPKVGPDLQGVTDRRERDWLKVQIQTPNVHHQQNDPVTLELRKTFTTPMPNLGLSDAEVEALVAFLGPGVSSGSSESGLPGPFLPTVGVGLAMIAGFTLVGLQAAKKKELEV